MRGDAAGTGRASGRGRAASLPSAEPKVVLHQTDTGAKAPTSLRNDLRRFTSQQLMDAALSCFERYGFRATTVERIVEVAGTTVPTFYRHFASKNELLIPLCTLLTAEVAKTVGTLNAGGWRSREGVRRWLDDYVIMWRRFHRLCAAFWEASDGDPEYAAKAIPETSSIVMLLPDFVNAIPPASRESIMLRVSLALMVMDRVVMLAEAESRPDRRGAIMRELAEIIWTSGFSRVAQADSRSRRAVDTSRATV